MQPQRCPGPQSRREFLKMGALALGGLTLSEVQAGRAAANSSSDRAVILFYCHGGASQLETYDLKPNAPSGIRSVFKPIATKVPGMHLCEHLPLQAKCADKFTLIRSLHHDVDIHSDGGIVALTGKRPTKLDPTSQSRSEHPDFGMIANKALGWRSDGLPRYVAIPQAPYFTQPAYLGLDHRPFVAGDPSSPGYRPGPLRLATGRGARELDNRRALLHQLDGFRRRFDTHGELLAADRFYEQAFRVLTSPAVERAFDLNREPATLRDRYGRDQFGQGCLLARRLVEVGVAVVTIMSNTPHHGPQFTNWDDHPGNAMRPGHFAEYMKTRLPYFDQSIAALIDDLYARGLDKRVLLVVTGEFGRTPHLRVGPPDRSIGRDHWPNAYAALVSGGGLRMGQVIGATNARSEYPTERPLTPFDLLATIYRHLGIDYHRELRDQTGRPIPILPIGEPIQELG